MMFVCFCVTTQACMYVCVCVCVCVLGTHLGQAEVLTVGAKAIVDDLAS